MEYRIRPIPEKSVDELLGYSMRPPFQSGLLERIAAARQLPLKELSVEQLRLLIEHSEAVAYLLPLALRHLEREPLAEATFFRGDLLEAVLRNEIHWFEHAELKKRVRAVVERALARLAVRPVDWWTGELPDPEEPSESDRQRLEPALRSYLERQRG